MKIKKIMTGIMAAVLLSIPAMGVYASDGEEYITITVQASDDNEGITYALDSDDPGSFGPSNMFTVPAGTSHVIYVKDAAGNITSQVYDPPAAETSGQEQTETEKSGEQALAGSSPSGDDTEDYTEDYTYSSSYSDDGQTIDIDLELKRSGSESGRPYEIKKDTPAEQGEGTVYSKTFLDGTDSSEQVFYSVTTAEGDVFYLLVDQGQEGNNVYLLNQVNNQDLASLAVDGGNVSQSRDDGDDSLLKALSSSSANEGGSVEDNKTAAKGGINRNSVIILILVAIGGGFYYYQKVYKTKKEQEMDAMEAPDMDQFSVSGGSTEDEEEFDFGYGEEDKEQYLMDLIKQDEEEYAAAAEIEAANTGWDSDEEDEEPAAETDRPGADISGREEDIFSDAGLELDGEYDPDLDGEEEVEE